MGEAVTIHCAFPSGLVLSISQGDWPAPDKLIPLAYGFTVIDKADWEAWLKANASYAPLVAGMIGETDPKPDGAAPPPPYHTAGFDTGSGVRSAPA
jgi:hypothetical protein